MAYLCPAAASGCPLGWEEDDTLRAVANAIWAKETKLISSFRALIQCRTRKDFVLFGHYLV